MTILLILTYLMIIIKKTDHIDFLDNYNEVDLVDIDLHVDVIDILHYVVVMNREEDIAKSIHCTTRDSQGFATLSKLVKSGIV